MWTTAGPFAVFVVLFALVAILRPAFLGGGGLAILATQATAILLVGLGQAMVLHVGSIDLSNAAIALFGAILLAKSLGSMGAGAIVLVIVVCSADRSAERVPDRVLPGPELRVDARHPRPAAGRVADHQ